MLSQPPSQFPGFQKETLEHFAAELLAAGSLDNFMLSKQAIRKRRYSFFILHSKNLKEYADTYLQGPYASAIPFFKKIKLPYDFWLQLYWSLLRHQAQTEWDDDILP